MCHLFAIFRWQRVFGQLILRLSLFHGTYVRPATIILSLFNQHNVSYDDIQRNPCSSTRDWTRKQLLFYPCRHHVCIFIPGTIILLQSAMYASQVLFSGKRPPFLFMNFFFPCFLFYWPVFLSREEISMHGGRLD